MCLMQRPEVTTRLFSNPKAARKQGRKEPSFGIQEGMTGQRGHFWSLGPHLGVWNHISSRLLKNSFS
jgi:hypothetical protein